MAAQANVVDAKAYFYKDKLIGVDGKMDHKVVEISTKEYGKTVEAVRDYVNGADVMDMRTKDSNVQALPIVGNERSVLAVPREAKIEGREYDTTKKEDLEALRQPTDMNYGIKGDEMIYYQNGMKNNMKDAEKVASKIEGITGQEVGILNNETHGYPKDVAEYLPSGITKKDVVNAQVYENISKNGDQNLIIIHSAGNEDAYNAMRFLAVEGRSLNNKVEFVSIGSPRSESDLKTAASKVGAEVLTQSNDWKDPITWGAAGMVVPIVGVAAVTGIKVGVTAGSATVMALPELGPYTVPVVTVVGLVAGGVAGGVEIGAIYTYHGADTYLDRNHNGVKTVIEDWARNNPTQVQK